MKVRIIETGVVKELHYSVDGIRNIASDIIYQSDVVGIHIGNPDEDDIHDIAAEEFEFWKDYLCDKERDDKAIESLLDEIEDSMNDGNLTVAKAGAIANKINELRQMLETEYIDWNEYGSHHYNKQSFIADMTALYLK